MAYLQPTDDESAEAARARRARDYRRDADERDRCHCPRPLAGAVYLKRLTCRYCGGAIQK